MYLQVVVAFAGKAVRKSKSAIANVITHKAEHVTACRRAKDKAEDYC